jgi:hypothetical protein
VETADLALHRDLELREHGLKLALVDVSFANRVNVDLPRDNVRHAVTRVLSGCLVYMAAHIPL